MKTVRSKTRGSGVARKISMGLAVAVVATAFLVAFGPNAPVADAAKPPKPSVVTISSPSNGASFAPDEEIFFTGTAIDKEDGDLSGQLVWTSDIVDDPIGTGPSFWSTLSLGVHTIDASATDSTGATGTASVTITVEEPPEPPPLGPWYVEIVDTGVYKYGEKFAIAYDLYGQPSIAYFKDPSGRLRNFELYFAHRTAVGWEEIEIVDSGRDLLRGVDLAYDLNDGNPSLTYVVGDNLIFAHKIGSAWSFEVVEETPVADANTSLVYDLSGYPSVAYRTEDGKDLPGGLKFARWNGTAWDTETVEIGASARYKSLAYDAAGNPSIAYQDRFESGLDTVKLARWSGASWNIEIVSSGTEGLGFYTQLAYDPTTGYPAILHKNSEGGIGNGYPEFFYWDETEWQSEAVCPTLFGSCARTGLAFDSSGTAKAGFHGSDASPGFAQRNGTDDWSGEAVEYGNEYGNNLNFFALAPDGTPSVAYVYGTDLTLRFAVRLPEP